MYLDRYDLKRIKRAIVKQLKEGLAIDDIRVCLGDLILWHTGDNFLEDKCHNTMYFNGRVTKKERANKEYECINDELAIRVFDKDDIQFTLIGNEDCISDDLIYLNI